jgi:hypothetical protein
MRLVTIRHEVACGPINEMVQTRFDMRTRNGTWAGCTRVSGVCVAYMGAHHMSNIDIHYIYIYIHQDVMYNIYVSLKH